MNHYFKNALLAIGSIVITLLLLEGGARFLFPTIEKNTCTTEHPTAIYQNQSNCKFVRQQVENPNPVTYSYNACGYRTPFECVDRAEVDVRAVSIGDSFMHGSMSPIEDHFMAKMLADLSREIPKPVKYDWQNLGTAGYDPLQYFARLDEMLALEPDLVIVSITPNDLFKDLSMSRLEVRKNLVVNVGAKKATKRDQERDLMGSIKILIAKSRAMSVASIFLMSSDSLYSKIYLARKFVSDYLSVPLTTQWQSRIDQLSILLEKMDEKAETENVILAVVFIPQRIQYVLKNIGSNETRIDPGILGRSIGLRMQKLGIHFIDGLEAFNSRSDNQNPYFPFDGHLTPEGNQFLGGYMATQIREMVDVENLFNQAR